MRWIWRVAWRIILRPNRIRKLVWRSFVGWFLLAGLSYGLAIGYPEQLWSMAIAVSLGVLAVGTLCLRLFSPTVAAAMLGMALSCGALMTALMVASGFERELIRQMTRINGHILLTKYGLDFSDYPAIVQRWSHDARIQAISPFAYSIAAITVVEDEQIPADMSSDESPAAAIVMAKALDPRLAQAWAGFPELLQTKTLQALRPGDVRYLPGIAIGNGVAQRLGVQVGDHVRLIIPEQLDGNAFASPKPPRHATLEVLDVLQSGFETVDDSLVLIHLTAGQSLFFARARVTGIEFQLSQAEQAQIIAAELAVELGNSYRTTPWQQQNIGTLQGIRQIKLAMIILLSMVEIVAACTLVASLLMLVRKNREAIAGLMVLGASRSSIFWLFEAVGFIVAVAGVLGGASLGGLSYTLLRQGKIALAIEFIPFATIPVALHWEDGIYCVAGILILCLLASGPMAVLAARQPLLASLRKELS